MSMYYAWRKGWDIGAGLLLALATSYKVTPALFFIYFAYKRSWRTLAWGLLGLGIFLIIVPERGDRAAVQRRVPGDVVAPHDHSVHCQERVEPAGDQPVAAGGLDAAAHEPDSRPGPLRYASGRERRCRCPPGWWAICSRRVAVGMLGLLAFLCRTKTTDRRDPRLARRDRR